MLQSTIESSTKTAVRTTIATSRFTAKRNELDSRRLKGLAGSMIMLSDGEFATVGGHGDLFERFLQTKQLSGYPGEKSPVVSILDDNYTDADLKLMRFDQTYDKLPYDASSRKFEYINYSNM